MWSMASMLPGMLAVSGTSLFLMRFRIPADAEGNGL